MTKRINGFTGLGAAAFLALALTFQGASAQTIRFWTFLDPAGQTGREMVLRKLIENFEAANPGVTVEVEPQVWQQLTDKFLAAHQTGTAPDVVWIHHSRIIEAINLGALANLDELFMKDWSREEFADLDDALFRFGATENAHYHILHSRSTRGQFYRVDLFDEAGIDPGSLTTWDKFIEAAKKLTERDADGNVVRWGYGQSFPTEGANAPVIVNVMLDEQGFLFHEEGRPAWSTEAGIKGMNLQLDMIRKHEVTPETAISMKDDDIYDQFNAGRMAMIRGGVTRLPRAVAALGPDKVGYLRTPSFSEGDYSPTEVVGWAAAVWTDSPNRELAGKFVEYISSPEADFMWVTEAGTVPIRKSTISENSEFFERPENAYLVKASQEMARAWLPPEGVRGGFNDALNRAAQDIMVNGTDTEEALRKAEEAYARRH